MTVSLESIAAAGVPIGLVVVGVLLGLVLRRTMMARVPAIATVPGPTLPGRTIAMALQGPVLIWCAMLGLYAAAQVAGPSGPATRVIRQTLLVLLVVSITWALARIAGLLIEPKAKQADRALRTPNLVTNMAKAFVLLLGGLILLQTLGIAITPLVTALGITGLAFALALQDTLVNLFAGIHLLISRQVRRGDFVRLSEGQEGIVQDITWRYTTIRHLSSITTVPNSKVASAITSNFTMRGGDHAVPVPGSVNSNADLQLVERVALAVAGEVMKEIPGAAEGFQPVFRFLALDDARIRFSVVLAGKNREAPDLMRHEFIKRLHQRFCQEKIA